MKYLAIYGASGYNGDDAYCFGSTGVIGIAKTEKEAEALVRKDAQKYIDDELAQFDECDVDLAEIENIKSDYYEKYIDITDELNTEDPAFFIEVNDEMIPKHYCARIVKI